MDKSTIKHERINIIGVGGVGSILVDLLHSQGYTKIKLIDFDIVETKNLKRQNFNEEDIGKPKSLVLAERYGYDFEHKKIIEGDKFFGDFIISCVDNNTARKVIREQRNMFKLFCANEYSDAEAYWGCDKTYAITEAAFDPTLDVEEEVTHCDSDDADPQTKLANMTSAIFAMHMLNNFNKKLFKEQHPIVPVMTRNCGQLFETIRIK